ncbi:MAG TPA: hypothetical protein VJL89_06175 [Thermodesulfovibrionia bacterium]|nr:hypothetical protein [Thermodesulfovibrionia bacterium]
MAKKIIASLMLLLLLAITAVTAAVPADLSCAGFANSTTQFCDVLDQTGTGIGLMSYKINLGLPALLIGLLIVGVVAGLVGAFVVVIVNSVKGIKSRFGGNK